MNRAIFLTVALCLLIAPVFTLPADKSAKQIEDFSGEKPVKHPEENEVNGDVKHDVEKVESSEIDKDSNPDLDADDETDIAQSSVNGQIAGVIERHGVEGEFPCRNFTCPAGTTRCTYDSKYGSGKNLEVHYKCTDKNGTVLAEKTQTESIESATNFHGFPDISSIFKQMEDFMKNMFRVPFWGDDTSIEDNDDQ